MTTKKTATGKGQAKKLRLKKETVKDLDAKGKENGVKGGALGISLNCATQTCACYTNRCKSLVLTC